MNFENLNNIVSPIEAENNEEREEKLNSKIEQISLVYAEKKWHEVKEKIPDYKFSEALKFYSPTDNIISQPLYNLEGFNFKDHKEKIDLFFGSFYQEVDKMAESGDIDLRQLNDLVNLKKNTIVNYLELGHLERFDKNKKEKPTKIIKFNEVDNITNNTEGKFKNLVDDGFSKSDRFLEVHFDSFYNADEKNLGPDLIKKDLAVIAEKIIKEHPETAAVIGKSWLLDTPIASRLGFKKSKDEGGVENDFTTWLQFVDRNGEIDQKRFNQFLESGKLPFKSTISYIPVEEFLKIYLPEELKGKVTLKKISPERIQEKEELDKQVMLLKDVWHEAIQSGNFEDFTGNQSFKKAFSFVEESDKEKLLNFYKKMFNEKIEDFSKYKDEEIVAANSRMSLNMKKYLYEDKEVIID